jgi:hypothetical protein
LIGAALTELLAREATAARLEQSLERAAPGTPPESLAPLAALLEDYLGRLPGAIDALAALTKTDGAGKSVAFVSGQALLYLVDEDDLFSEHEVGALGLVDDAYFVDRCIAALVTAFPGIAPPVSYRPPDPRTIVVVRSILPPGVADALDRTSDNLVRVAAALFAGNGVRAPAGPSPSPALRVDEALASLA